MRDKKYVRRVHVLYAREGDLGTGLRRKHARLLSSMGKRALIVTGKSSARNGALKDVQEALLQNGQEFVVFDEVTPNPTVACVQKGAEKARAFSAEFVVGIGGGFGRSTRRKRWRRSQDSPAATARFFREAGRRTSCPSLPYPRLRERQRGDAVCRADRRRQGNEKQHFLSRFVSEDLFSRRQIYGKIGQKNHRSHGGGRAFARRRGNVYGKILARKRRFRARKYPTFIFSFSETGKREPGTFFGGQGCPPVRFHAGGNGDCTVGDDRRARHGYFLTYYHGADHGEANGVLLGEMLALCFERLPETVGKILGAAGLPDVDSFKNILKKLLKGHGRYAVGDLRAYAKRASENPKLAGVTYRPEEKDLLRIFLNSDIAE